MFVKFQPVATVPTTEQKRISIAEIPVRHAQTVLAAIPGPTVVVAFVRPVFAKSHNVRMEFRMDWKQISIAAELAPAVQTVVSAL